MSSPHQSSPSAAAAITLRELTFEWPDGSVALDGLSGTFGHGRTALIGDNGTGKSTLLKLVAGLLQPSSGSIVTTGEVGYLPQTLTLDGDATIARLLGIAPVVTALRAIEAGDVAQHHFDAVGDDWDVEARAVEALARLDLAWMRDGTPAGVAPSSAVLDRTVGALSGGEAMLVAIAGLRLRELPITLLDEPTNNLDREGRARVGALVDDWPGALVVVSHDLELLERVDATAELHGGHLTTFGGAYSAWRENLDREQSAAAQAARAAEQTLRAEKRQRVEAETKLARRARTARQAQLGGGIPRILAGGLANRAQASAGALRSGHDSRIDTAQAAVDRADARVREVQHIRLDLPDPAVPRGRRIAELRGSDGIVVHLQGPERIALVGANGVGKTTLLLDLLSSRPADPAAPTSGSRPADPAAPTLGGRPADPAAGAPGSRPADPAEGAPPSPPRASGVLATDRVGYLSQRLDDLDPAASALEEVQRAAPGVPPARIRDQLARLLLRGAAVDRPLASLSGGERFRVALARLLLADPPLQLLVLDEPTNNLDLSSVDQLVEALAAYRGALLVVSHDDAFLRRLAPDTTLELTRDGRLVRADEGAGHTGESLELPS
ncbi:ATP-binding cassette domain-containing protein [Herbiconiux sp. KACC 21604]|uniref:ATP-binding cassette domain-containing protein n=1 Tax=unclassified Herbiconiux TaxID=2618217 RepID=UPI0014911FC4|nr:ATP-binding cassette domain-containing protein [Herbiconiux sp. SALV-R1]QJU54247.1 ABC-F family ATP-binding cassette domain-containing protein [Herbiconiux sp. SALV-R1]WPO85312.1 ATP-binding cassette domain-containing protein [Herbiconiux sp. KACC 21604]